jgi:hypothetical protein
LCQRLENWFDHLLDCLPGIRDSMTGRLRITTTAEATLNFSTPRTRAINRDIETPLLRGKLCGEIWPKSRKLFKNVIYSDAQLGGLSHFTP